MSRSIGLAPIAGAMQTHLARQLEDAKALGESMRRYAISMAQTVALEESGPLLARSVLEAVVLFGLYIAFLHHLARRWHLLSGLPDPFAHVSLVVPITFTIGYLAFVYYGSRYMRLRKEPVVTRVFESMLVYNLYQTVLNLCCLLAFGQEVWRQGLALWGNHYAYTEDQYHLGFLLWLHYTNTYLGLLDTVFILLRKKFRMMSFLHVYERLLMVWWWFLVCRLACGGDVYLPAMIHTAVNVATYGHYLLTLLKLPTPRRERVTQLHMARCFLCALHALLTLWCRSVPVVLGLIQLFVMGNLNILFTDFHYRQRARHTINAEDHNMPHTVFSFDSSGWLFLYHFGVAKYLREHFLPKADLPSVAYSGASGGALVATALCSNVDLDRLIDFVVSCRKSCYYAPWRLMGAVEEAINIFMPTDAHVTCTQRIRILITKVLPRPPFVMGEVACEFQNWKHLAQVLRASCHVPLIGGVLPFHMTEAGGGWYYDGLFWSSGLGFVPWRAVTDEDRVIRISGLGIWGALVKPPVTFPPWWCLVPPAEDTLRGMVAQGYYDAARALGPKAAMEDGSQAVPEGVLQFQEDVFRAWMLAVLALMGAVTALLAALL
eukprot:GGOE01040925.1.p1 GENE.GGOE01040925.1~~GGOE01040925.1.p1  ORF type:complete len:604 (-),score=213.92 GGOE01040925.1:514-2325(-)